MWGMRQKVVIITGSGNGIGRATAMRFAEEDAHVIVADIDYAAAQATALDIEQNGGSAMAIECDVSQAKSVRGLVEKVMEKYDGIDILYANAAVQITKPATEITEEEWDCLHGVNLKGVFLICKYVIPVMRNQHKGSIIISSSGHAFVTYPRCSAYAATKGGEIAYMRGLAVDCAQDGIRVNCVIPGATDTRLVQSFLRESSDPEEARKRLLDKIPLRRLAEPEEIAQAVLFLASDYAAYVTGTSLAVDGGLLAQG